MTPYAAGRLAARYGSTAVTLHIGETPNRSVAEDAVALIESSGLEPVMKIEQGSPYPLLMFVQPSCERKLDPVRRDNSFPEKQESHLARLLVVQIERLVKAVLGASYHANAKGERVRRAHRAGRAGPLRYVPRGERKHGARLGAEAYVSVNQ